MTNSRRVLTSLEICSGAGGQALGIERAGFEHVGLVEVDKDACRTLKKNRPYWNVIECDVRNFSAKDFKGVDLFAGGVPCPPFSVAGKQLGSLDERDLFPEAIRLIKECQPKSIILENVKGLFSEKFAEYRESISKSLNKLGYYCEWKMINSSDFGVPQSRTRTILLGVHKTISKEIRWPEPMSLEPPTVGEALFEIMKSNGWEQARDWKKLANKVAPTLVGGSKKHGGPDLGPTGAKRTWASMGIDGIGIANEPPTKGFKGLPRLTVEMVSIIQGFPPEWKIEGKKTSAYRQVGNAFPPPVAQALGECVADTLSRALENSEPIKGQNASPRKLPKSS